MSNDEVYFFDLRMVCGGYAYYLTHTIFVTFSEKGREIRSPSTVSKVNFLGSARLFNQKVYIIDKAEDYDYWIYKRGWAVVEVEFARNKMEAWLRSAECTKSPLGLFTDVKIISPGALKHSTKKGRKDYVLSRDKRMCLACGATENNGVTLTMQHIKPFSRAGETTSHNLVTLCHDCNQRFAADEVISLYEKAKLHFGYDPSIINDIPTSKSRIEAYELSDNLMQTRCEIW